MSKVILDKTMDSPVFEYNEHTIEFAVKDDVNPIKWGFYSDDDFIELNPSALPKLPNNIILGTPQFYTAYGYYPDIYVETAKVNVTLTKGTYIYSTNVVFAGYDAFPGQVGRDIISGEVTTIYGGRGSAGHGNEDTNTTYSGFYCGGINVKSDSATIQYWTTTSDSYTCSNTNPTCVTVCIIPVTFKDPE